MCETVTRESLKKFFGHHDTDDDNSFDHRYIGVLDYTLINGRYDLQPKLSFLRYSEKTEPRWILDRSKDYGK